MPVLGGGGGGGQGSPMAVFVFTVVVVGGSHVVHLASLQAASVKQSFGVFAVHVTAKLPATQDLRLWFVPTVLSQRPGPCGVHKVPPQGVSILALKQAIWPPQAADSRASDAVRMLAGADWLANRPAIAATPNRIVDLIAVSPCESAAGSRHIPFLGTGTGPAPSGPPDTPPSGQSRQRTEMRVPRRNTPPEPLPSHEDGQVYMTGVEPPSRTNIVRCRHGRTYDEMLGREYNAPADSPNINALYSVSNDVKLITSRIRNAREILAKCQRWPLSRQAIF
jgi:hypothetical protein